MFHRGTGRSAQSAGRAMEDTHYRPSLQCTGTTVLGITPRCVRDISEDADSAITWVGKGWRGSPQGISGSATQGGIHVDERNRSSMLAALSQPPTKDSSLERSGLPRPKKAKRESVGRQRLAVSAIAK